MAYYSVRRAKIGDARDTLWARHSLISAGGEIEALVAAVPGIRARCQQTLDVRAYRFASGPHAVQGLRDTGCIPKLERPQFPVEARTHRAIYISRILGDLGQAIG